MILEVYLTSLGNILDTNCWAGTGVRQQCLQQSRSIVETEFLGGDSSLSSAALEMLEDELMTEVLGPFPSLALEQGSLPMT